MLPTRARGIARAGEEGKREERGGIKRGGGGGGEGKVRIGKPSNIHTAARGSIPGCVLTWIPS
eukprot:2176754-Pyramimonas_sp.AAC.1